MDGYADDERFQYTTTGFRTEYEQECPLCEGAGWVHPFIQVEDLLICFLTHLINLKDVILQPIL